MSLGLTHSACSQGKDSTFKFLETVLSEVMDLFPSSYIHIGGDEVRLMPISAIVRELCWLAFSLWSTVDAAIILRHQTQAVCWYVC